MAAEVRVPVLDEDRADGAGVRQRARTRQRTRCREVGQECLLARSWRVDFQVAPGSERFGMRASLGNGFHSRKFAIPID